MSDLQANLAEFIRRLGLDDNRLDQLERRVTAAGEGVRNLWTDGLGGSNMCVTTIKPQFKGGPFASIALPGVSWRAVGHTTGTDYGTYTAAQADLILDAADTQLDFNLTGYRWNTSYTQTVSVNRCEGAGSNTWNLLVVAGSGFHFLPGYGWPVADTMSLEDSVFGNRSVTYANPGIWFPGFTDAAWGATARVTTVAGTCASATADIQYSTMTRVNPFAIYLFWDCVNSASSRCPNTAGPQITGDRPFADYTETSAPTETTKLDVTWSVPGGSTLLPYGAGSATIRLREP